MFKGLLGVILIMSGTGAWIERNQWAALVQWALAAVLFLWLWSGIKTKKQKQRRYY